jgi:hypothetical protein
MNDGAIERMFLHYFAPMTAWRHMCASNGSWAERVDRAPAVESDARSACTSRWLGPGTPAAPVSARLALLPPGPDAVHRVTLRGT